MQPQETKINTSTAFPYAMTNCQKNLRKRVHSQAIHSALMMSGHLFKVGSYVQRIILNKQGEYVMLNEPYVTFRRLKRSCIIYLGASTNITNQNDIVYVDSIYQLQNYFQKLDTNYDKDVTFHILYEEIQKQQDELQKFIRFYNKFKIKDYPFNEKTDENISYYEKIQMMIISIKNNQQSYQFPSFSEISIYGNNKKINQQRYTMYTFFAGLDFQQARLDLVKFYEYILDNNIFLWNQEDLKSIIEHYKSYDKPRYRNSQVILKFYTSYVCCYKLINMCLRSLLDSRDLAYIRLLFLDIFISVVELFTKQKQIRKNFSQTQKRLYRGCFFLQNQINQLQKLKGRYIQMNGFLSISMKKDTAQSFHFLHQIQNKNGIKALVVIDLPYIEKSIDIFHSFAFIQQVSQYQSEKQVLFNPLNAFKVINVKKIDQKYYQIHLEYADIAKLTRQYKERIQKLKNQNDTEEQTQQQKLKDEIQQKITTNFYHHKSTLELTRTQGEALWRNKKQFSDLFYSSLIRNMLNKEKASMQSHSQYQNYEFKFIKVSTLYKQLQKFIPDFEWFPSYNKNIQLVARLVINNKEKAIQIFFYTSKVFNNLYCYERSIIYSLTCFQLIIPYSSMVWLVGVDIGQMLFNLGKIDQALAVFDWQLQKLKKIKKQINSANLQFFLFPMYILFTRNETEKYKKLKELIINKLDKLQKSKINTLWRNLLLDLTDMKAIKRFLEYYKQIAQFPSRSFIKIIIFVIQYLQKQFDSDSADLSNEKIAIMKEDLEIAANCLVNFQNLYECYKPLSKIFVIYFGQDQQKYDFAQIQKTVASSKFSNMFCYELQIYLTTLKYVFKTCKKLQIKPIKQYTRLMINLSQYLRKLNNHYLNDIYYTVMSLYCEATVLSNKKSLQNEIQKNKSCLMAVKSFLKVLVHHI